MSLKTDAKYDTTVMMVFTFIGLIVKIFLAQPTSSDGSTGPANATVWGYGIIAIALFCTIFIKFALSNPDDLGNKLGSKMSIFKFISSMARQTMPITVVFFILLWTVFLNTNYQSQINKGNVTPTFDNMSMTSTFLLFFQLLLVFYIVRSEITKEQDVTMKLISQLSALSYLIGTINFVMLGIMNISLVYFSTDG